MCEGAFEVELTKLIGRLADREDLSGSEAEAAFDRFMEGSASEIEMAALLMGLRMKGVQPVEVAGGVRALRTAMIPVSSSDPEALVDTAGTGGGSVTTFNISTAAALIAAGGGVPIAKHGNRSFTSRCGSADVLEALASRSTSPPNEWALFWKRQVSSSCSRRCFIRRCGTSVPCGAASASRRS